MTQNLRNNPAQGAYENKYPKCTQRFKILKRVEFFGRVFRPLLRTKNRLQDRPMPPCRSWRNASGGTLRAQRCYSKVGAGGLPDCTACYCDIMSGAARAPRSLLHTESDEIFHALLVESADIKKDMCVCTTMYIHQSHRTMHEISRKS